MQALNARANAELERPMENRQAVVMATGLGKTITFGAEAAAEPGRSLILVHTDELAQQAEAKVALMAPGRSVGVVKAERDDTDAEIIIGSVQTLANPDRLKASGRFDRLIIDECFPAGTVVGNQPIESLKPGDMVPSWNESTGREVLAPVVELMRRVPKYMTQVTLASGEVIACTSSHPILTPLGWCPAGMLLRGESVVSFTHDADASGNDLHVVRRLCDPDREGADRRAQEDGAYLLPRGMQGRLGKPGFFSADGADQSKACLGADAAQQPHDAPGDSGEVARHLGGDGSSSAGARRERQGSTGAPGEAGSSSRLADGGQRGAGGRGASVSLQDRRSAPDNEGVRGGGRWVPFLAGAPSLRPAPGRKAVTSRVVDVQILEPGSDGTYGGVCPDGAVYNIEVAGTHTYLIGRGVVVHNCHHAVSPTYREIMHTAGGYPWSARSVWPIPVTGYTATLERGDGQSLGGVWHDVAFSRDIGWAVRKGFLVPPVGYTVTVPELAFQASDAAMDSALVDSIAPEKVVDAWLEHASDRSTVLFAPLVRSARAFAQAFAQRGIAAGVVHGAMSSAHRRTLLAAYEAGEIQVLCNAMVLTEGWDSPRTKCVIVARPTKSRPLFIQMAGRGLRRWLEGEYEDCVLLCVADSTTELRSIADLSDRPGLEAQDGKSLTQLEDEFDLSQDLEPDPEYAYAGAVDVSRFDPLVARSSKVWTKTRGGALFIPAGKGEFVFLAPDAQGLAVAYVDRTGGRRVARNIPDTELAMAMAEDFAVDHGGDMGRLLADKGRAWRKGVPSEAARDEAIRLGLDKELARIMAGRSAGKAGKLSDLLSTVKASRVIDPVVEKIKQRTGR